MIPIGVQAVVAGIPAIYKFFESRKQRKMAKKLLNTPRPVREVAGGVMDNVRLAKNRMAQDMPGMGYLNNQIQGATANAANMAVQSGQSPNAILGTIAGLNANQLDQMGNLNYKNAVYKDSALNTMMGANRDLANEQNAVWDWNKKEQYLRNMAAASALQNASGRNLYSAINDFSNIGVGVLDSIKSAASMGKTGNVSSVSPIDAFSNIQTPEMSLAPMQTTGNVNNSTVDIPQDKMPLVNKYLSAGIPMSEIRKMLLL